MTGKDDEQPEALAGGGVTDVVRIGDTVHRHMGRWSGRVHTLLRHLEAVGFEYSPRLRGVEGDYEVLDFLPGTVGNYPFPEAIRSDAATATAAAALRRLHDCTESVAPEMVGGWMLEDRTPTEVVCHGDFAPYNCVFDGPRLTGIIDFDTAHTGPRVWDIGHGIYRFAPLSRPENDDSFGSPGEQVRRARLFCDEYGLEDRSAVVDAVTDRLLDHVAFMRAEASAGNAAFASHVADGHDDHYLRDVDYIGSISDELRSALA